MNIYTSFATALNTLLADDTAITLTAEGFMPLSIEDIGPSAEGHRQIAISHTATQNGDLMRDPEMVFRFITDGVTLLAEPISFRNDFMGINQEVYRYNEHGKATHLDTRLKAELKSFARMWFRNLKQQGFYDKSVIRKRLS